MELNTLIKIVWENGTGNIKTELESLMKTEKYWKQNWKIFQKIKAVNRTEILLKN